VFIGTVKIEWGLQFQLWYSIKAVSIVITVRKKANQIENQQFFLALSENWS
jgi:hypothetical protein